eukprot:COSAG03_NODE_387_length_8309_cov_2.520828_4_plen_112_part_00
MPHGETGPGLTGCRCRRCFGRRRLTQELQGLMMQPVEGVSAFPNGDNIFDWAATIEGSAGTVRCLPLRVSCLRTFTVVAAEKASTCLLPAYPHSSGGRESLYVSFACVPSQ